MEGYEQFDDDAAAPFSFGPPSERTWRHPSELAPAPITVAAPNPGGFTLRTLSAACAVALAASVVAVAMTTLVVSTRQTTPGARGLATDSSATTVDSRLGHLLTLVVEDATGRRSVPGVVLDKVGTIVAAWAGFDQAKSVSLNADGGDGSAVRVERAGGSQLALVKGVTESSASPLGSCDNLHVGSSVEVMTASGSGTGEVTAMTHGPVDAANTSLPILLVKTSDKGDIVHSVIWHDGKIIAMGVDRTIDGLLIAIPSDVVIGLTRSAQAATTAVPWLGVTGTNVAGNGGVLVASVNSSSSVRQRLQANDTIVAINGQPVGTMWALTVALRRYLVGETIELRVIADGETRNVAVTLAAKPADGTLAAEPMNSPPR